MRKKKKKKKKRREEDQKGIRRKKRKTLQRGENVEERKERKRRIGRGCHGEGTLIGVTEAGGQFDCKAEMQFVPTAMVDLFKN